MDIVIINLVHRSSRRARILALADALKCASQSSAFPIRHIHLMEAVDGVTFSFADLETHYDGLRPFPEWQLDAPLLPSSWRARLTSGGIASGLSHMDVPKVGPQDTPYILVLEDDCVLKGSDIEAFFRYCCDCITQADQSIEEWDMLLMGAAGHRPDLAPATPLPPTVSSTPLIEIAGFSYLTTMYVLSRAGVKKIDRNRKLTIPNMLPFDELHNALAGLTPRADVQAIISEKCEKLILLSSLDSYVRQDPFDCVHDTTVSASAKQSPSDDTEPQGSLSSLFPYKAFFPLRKKLVPVTWWRRDSSLTQPQVQTEATASRAPRIKRKRGVLEVMNRLRAGGWPSN